ncbi:MAG: cysteine hydrolase family protein, partial [Nitrososphaerales archaeon]
MKAPKPVRMQVKISETLLIIVDMQYDFCNPKGPYYIPMTKRVIPNIKSILEKARTFDMLVIHTNSHAYPTPRERRWKKLRGSFDGWHGPEVDALKPVSRPKEYIIPKTTHDIFFQTTMDDLLNLFPLVNTVIVT